MESSTLSCGPDTLHLTFREGGGRCPEELSGLLAEFQRMYDLPSAAVRRDRGVQGFAAAAVDKAAGLRLDWTRPGEEGTNPGYFCLQVGGQWFTSADGETQADFLQLLQAYGPLRCTRIDFQQTVRTDSLLTPWWIEQFEARNIRVLGRKHYEPRGRKDFEGGYPAGATLYHGTRTSERFARQYDKHLQAKEGEPRRRDEIEIKGQSCRDLWNELQIDLIECEQRGIPRGASLYAFSKRSIRAYLPIRDTSRWAGKDLPRNWAQMATEPLTWANLFEEDALTIKPREKAVTSLLKSYRYATTNFGAALTTQAVVRSLEFEDEGYPKDVAYAKACQEVIRDCAADANEDRVQEFASEFHIGQASRITAQFLALRDIAKQSRRLEDEGLDGPIGRK